MTKNGNGDGSVYQRSDGRWVAALQIGFKSNGKQDVRMRYAKTEQEAKRKLREMKKAAYQETPEQRCKLWTPYLAYLTRRLFSAITSWKPSA